MPYALALTLLPKPNAVIFSEQLDWLGSISRLLVVLLDGSWDHNGAFECSPDGIPIKIRVDRFRDWIENARHLALQPSEMEYHTHTSHLSKASKSYFMANAEMKVEIEDVVKLLGVVEKVWNEEWGKESQLTVLDRFFAQYGFEGTRWLLLALLLTLVENSLLYEALPEEFEVLRRQRTCFLA
jgi:hypothetical protein